MGFKVWIQEGCGFNQCLPSVFGIVAKFPWQKLGRISPYFRGKNPAMLCLRCVIANKTLFSPSFRRENTAMGMPHFHSENLAEFRIWCAMAHLQGFMPIYAAHANMLALVRAEAPQSIKHIDTCHIHGETNVTWWHGSGRSHRCDYAHSMIWICTYNKCLEHILMSQGPKHSWLEKVAHVATRVHH